MNIQRCLTIAVRIKALLQFELDHAIDPQRMVDEPLYARDVLLVCDTFHDGDLASLARHFRTAAAEPPPAAAAAARQATAADRATAARRRMGFNASRFLDSLFGAPAASDRRVEPPPLEPLPAPDRPGQPGR
jgi:hypothetical protein